MLSLHFLLSSWEGPTINQMTLKNVLTIHDPCQFIAWLSWITCFMTLNIRIVKKHKKRKKKKKSIAGLILEEPSVLCIFPFSFSSFAKKKQLSTLKRKRLCPLRSSSTTAATQANGKIFSYAG